MLNPPTTLTFESLKDAREHLDMLRFTRMPVPGLIQRYVSEQVADDGTPIMVFASGTGRPNTEDGTVSFHFVEMVKKGA